MRDRFALRSEARIETRARGRDQGQRKIASLFGAKRGLKRAAGGASTACSSIASLFGAKRGLKPPAATSIAAGSHIASLFGAKRGLKQRLTSEDITRGAYRFALRSEARIETGVASCYDTARGIASLFGAKRGLKPARNGAGAL